MDIEVGLERLAKVHKIPYTHVHMAFYTFHRVINRVLRRQYPYEDPFLITHPEVVLITYMYGMLPKSSRERGNLTRVLYGLLTYYFSFWGVDFVKLGVRKIGRILELDNLREFERFVLYLCTQYYGGMYGITEHHDAYNAWESYLFQLCQNVSNV